MATQPTLEPFSGLLAKGLRITGAIDTRGKHIRVSFEAPAQLNNARMFYYKDLSIGMYSYLRTGTVRHVKSIGRYCSIGPGVTIGEGEHPTGWLSTSPSQYTLDQFKFYPPEKDNAPKRQVKRNATNHDGATGDVVIGNDVWIGGGATIRRGLTIGDGAIVAGNAFVTKDVAPYSIVAGMPAKHIRYRFSDDIIARLMALKWWRFDINNLRGIPFDDIETAIFQIEQREKEGKITPIVPSYNAVTVYTKGQYDFKAYTEKNLNLLPKMTRSKPYEKRSPALMRIHPRRNDILKQ